MRTNLDQYNDTIDRFINELFPNTLGVMVAGSITTPHFNENSDIDLVIISPLYNDIFIESYLYDEIKMQVIMLPVHGLKDLLYREVSTGEGVYLTMFNSGIILQDKFKILEKAKTLAISLYSTKPKALSQYEIDNMRAMITTRLEDLAGNKTYEESLFIGLDVYTKILTLYTKYNRLWHSAGKFASRELMHKNKKLHTDYISSFTNFVLHRNPIFLYNFIKETLDKLGGPLHFFSTRSVKENISENKLVVFIALGDRNLDESVYLEEIGKFQNSVIKRVPQLLYTILYMPENSIFKRGIYIIMNIDKKKIIDYILPHINLYRLNAVNSSLPQKNWYFPYQQNPLESIGNNKIQQVILSYLKKISDFLLLEIQKREYIRETSCNYCLFILNHFSKLEIFQNNKELFIDFLDFCFECTINSNTLISQSISSELRTFYYDSDIKSFEDAFLKEKENFKLIVDEVINSNILNGLLNIENQVLNLKNTNKIEIYEYTLIKNKKLSEKERQLFAILYKVQEKTQQALFMQNKYKAYVIYCLSHLI